MNTEIASLLFAVLLGLIYISAAALSYKLQVGNSYSAGPRDKAIPPAGMAGRLRRAQLNYFETFPLYAVCMLLLIVQQKSGFYSDWGNILYLTGRTFYLPLYASGIPWLRSVSWTVATFGLAATGVQVLINMSQ